MHDLVIGLVINILEFGLKVSTALRFCRTWPEFCNAINKNYIKFGEGVSINEIFANDNTQLIDSDIQYQVGGTRSKTEAETMELIESELSKLGKKINIQASSGNPFTTSGLIYSYRSCTTKSERSTNLQPKL